MTNHQEDTMTWLAAFKRNRHLRLALKYEALASTMTTLTALATDQERTWGRWKGLADYHRQRFNELETRRTR